MTLDEILDKHLPDKGLCQRLKAMNKARKLALLMDIKAHFSQPISKFPKGGEMASPFPAMIGDSGEAEIILTEQQLEAIGDNLANAIKRKS